MPDLVAYDAKDLVVCHQVHEAAVNPYAAVCACKSINLICLVYLEIQRGTVYLGDT